MTQQSSSRLLRTSLAAALALPAMLAVGEAPALPAGIVHCYGVNRCKGTGDCAGAPGQKCGTSDGHSCAGQNACKHRGYVDMDEATCLRLEGGRLTPSEGRKKAETKSDGN